MITSKTVGEMLKTVAAVDDVVIAAADAIADAEPNFDARCRTFVDSVTVGRALAVWLATCPSGWDGTSVLVVTETDDLVTQSEDLAAILPAIARSRVRIDSDTSDEDILKRCLVALIQNG